MRADVLAGVAHGFTGRIGGVSTGMIAGLNTGLGAEDDADNVAANRAAVVEAVLPGSQLVTPYQIHSADAVIATVAWNMDDRPRADAVVTDRQGLLLGIVTADCGPILLADRMAGVVAATHAGWRGAHEGIVEATVASMESLGAERQNIAAAIGPCIAQLSYEVDRDFRDRFSQEDECYFARGKPDHWQFDLPAYVASRLRHAGIGNVEDVAQDTYSQPDRFFSYRRATHRGQAIYGRQISVIGLH